MAQNHDVQHGGPVALLEKPPHSTRSQRDTEPILKLKERAERVLGEQEQDALVVASPPVRIIPLILVSVLATIGMVLSLVTLATLKGAAQPFWWTALLTHLPPWYVFAIGGLVVFNISTVFFFRNRLTASASQADTTQPLQATVNPPERWSGTRVEQKAGQSVSRGVHAQPEARTTEAPARFPRALWILCIGIFINRLGSFVAPFLILIMLARGYTVAQAGIVVGVYGLGSMIASLAGGYMADVVGRRATIVLSMFSSVIPVLLLSQVTALSLILLLAANAGLTTGLYRPAASALLADLVPAKQRVKAFAWYRFMLNLGFAVGPALAGFLASYAFTFLFVADAASSIIFGLIALLLLPAGKGGTLVEQHEQERVSLVTPAPGKYRFVFFLVGSLAVALVYFQMDATLPLQVLAFGLPKVVFGMLLSLNGVIVLLLELPLSSVTQRFSQRWVIVVGWILTGLGFGLTAIASSIPLLAVTVVLWTIGEILHHPASAAYVADLAPGHMRGRYQGAWEFTWSLAQTLGPVAGTLAFARNAPLFWLACGTLACLAALPLLSRQRVRKVVTPADQGDVTYQYQLGLMLQLPASLLSSEAYQQARIELALMKIWSQVLSRPLDTLKVTSDFFGCGGDSDSLAAMVNEVSQRLHIPLDAGDCFEHPVLSHLAAHLVQRQKGMEIAGEGSVAS